MEPDNYIFVSEQEIIDTCKIFNDMCLLVPSGLEYYDFANVILTGNFSEHDFDEFKQAFEFINQFKPFVSIINQSNGKNEAEITKWPEKIRQLLKSSVGSKILNIKDLKTDFVDFVKTSKPDLTIIFEERQGFFKIRLSQNLMGQSI